MDPEKKTTNKNNEQASVEDQAPADALSRTPEELADEKAEQISADPNSAVSSEQTGVKKVSPVKRLFRKINLYFLLFGVIVVVAGAITIVNYLNSQKATPEATIASQELTENALKQLANTDASVGDSSQTLTIQGNAIIEGQTLMRGNLNIAGNLQTGGSIQGPNLTISGKSNLGETQINRLQIASNLAVQGDTTMDNLNVAGTSSFSGAVTASRLTVTQLVLSGNAVLQVPNHISFTGPTPSRTINSGVLGGGGSASINGSDTAGTVNINTGNNPAAGCFLRINFAKAFTSQPRVVISPVGLGAGKTQYYVDRNTTGFSICTASPSPANQAFAYDYFITN